MFEEYLTWWHLKALIIYILANSALPWYVMWRNRRIKPDSKRDIERFDPWVRKDYDKWNPWTIPFTSCLFLIRFATLMSTLISAFITTQIITIGISDLANLGPLRK